MTEPSPRRGPAPDRGRGPVSTSLAVLLCALVALPAGAGARGNGTEVPQPSPETIEVWAAASLADVLPAVAAAWEAEGGAPVVFSFAATSRVARQIEGGAPADIFASADLEWMDWASARALVDSATIVPIATNRLVVVAPRPATPPGPGAGASERDAGRILPQEAEALFASEGPLVLADPNVPAGRYADAALEALGIRDRLADRIVRAGSVRQALEWVARGDAGAGIVYRTDALAEPRVAQLALLPDSLHPPIVYPTAVVATSAAPATARAFLDFVRGPRGRAIFEAAGFGPSAGAQDAGVGGGPTRDPPEEALETPSTPQTRPGAVGDPWTAIRLSLLVALAVVLAGLVPAVALGWLLARRDFPGKGLLSVLVFSPLVLPPVVTGFLLLSLLGAGSTLGGFLEGIGIRVPFTLVGAILAALVVGMPLYVVSVRMAFAAVDVRLEEVAHTLGKTRLRAFVDVTLPLAAPGIAAGAVLAFARALGEFGATIVLAGNVEGRTQTIALAIYSALEAPGDQGITWLLVGASVLLSLLGLLGFEWLSRRLGSRGLFPAGAFRSRTPRTGRPDA